MVTGDLVRPARNRRLLLAFALLLVLVAVALVAAHALLGAVPAAHALGGVHKLPCGGGPFPC